MYKGTIISLSVNFSAETLEARRVQDNMFKRLGKKTLPTKNIFPGKTTFRNEGEINTLPDKQKLREVITPRLALQEVLKGSSN